jgi:hypothetical protein
MGMCSAGSSADVHSDLLHSGDQQDGRAVVGHFLGTAECSGGLHAIVMYM